MFKNKHVIMAMIIAPILAIMAYIGVDLMVKENPKAATAGASYPLVAKSKCRYESGECTLKNADFSTTVKIQEADGIVSLVLNASHPLDGVKVGFSQEGENIENSAPQQMNLASENRENWILPVGFKTDENTTLAIALTANGAHYFGQTKMAFSKYETIFKEDFRRE